MTLLKTAYDVKHYKNCLAYNEKRIDDLGNVNRVTIHKEAWEPPMLTVWRDDKQLGSWVIDRYPKTKQGASSKALKLVAQELKEIEVINANIRVALEEAETTAH